jgi:hypothetical protein
MYRQSQYHDVVRIHSDDRRGEKQGTDLSISSLVLWHRRPSVSCFAQINLNDISFVRVSATRRLQSGTERLWRMRKTADGVLFPRTNKQGAGRREMYHGKQQHLVQQVLSSYRGSNDRDKWYDDLDVNEENVGSCQ